MGFRIAIGHCGCGEPYRDQIEKVACSIITTLIASWESRLPAELAALPSEAYEEEQVEGLAITLGTHKHTLDDGDTLVVFQAFVRTWSRPTYLSIGAVGRMYAEGLLVSASGLVSSPPDDLMWGFR